MGKYETLLVDESHDMQEWQLELLELHLKPQGSVYMAMGPGLALYRADTGAPVSYTHLDVYKRQDTRSHT